jgi:hypothetical protein
MNVKVFRLNSGEEIITRFEEHENHVTFKDPAILIPMKEGQIGIMPWLIYTKASQGINVPNTFISFSIEPLDEMKQQYDASLNRGIVTPSKSVKNTSSPLKLTMD